LVNVTPPVAIVLLFAVVHTGSVPAVPPAVQRNTHCALRAGAVGFTILPMTYVALGTNAEIRA
jgi:hypothetical protein